MFLHCFLSQTTFRLISVLKSVLHADNRKLRVSLKVSLNFSGWNFQLKAFCISILVKTSSKRFSISVYLFNCESQLWFLIRKLCASPGVSNFIAANLCEFVRPIWIEPASLESNGFKQNGRLRFVQQSTSEKSQNKVFNNQVRFWSPSVQMCNVGLTSSWQSFF